MDTQSVTDDQELAKVLAGVSQQADSNLQFEETGTTPTILPSATPDPAPAADPVADASATLPAVDPATPVAPTTPDVAVPTPDIASTTAPAARPELEKIKHDALLELRPLVGKLNLAPEEKFDTYLLLLRSTDDQDLIAPAHEAAIAITDEARRAQALLDIIKEIDYLSTPKQ